MVPFFYYVHDHLYSPAALVDSTGTVLERYEYDAYGNPYILDTQYAPRTTSHYGNPYLFTGRRVDILDSGSLKIQYNRNRYYDYYSGRWLTHDPLGYVDGMNLYEYSKSNPIILTDPIGGCADKEDLPCECYCVEDMHITGHKTQDLANASVGAEFTVTLRGKWKEWNCPFKRPECQWNEWFTMRGTGPVADVYDDLDTNTWHDIYEVAGPDHPFFAPLKEKKDVYVLTDTPGLDASMAPGYYVQKSWFLIAAKSTEGCPCGEGRNWDEVYAKHFYTAERFWGGLHVYSNEFEFFNTAPFPDMPQPLPAPIGE